MINTAQVRPLQRALPICISLICCLVLPSFAQIAPVERKIHAAKADVEKTLHGMQGANGGRLPILDGFVASTDSLDRYQRGYYQYSIEVQYRGAEESVVRATARITAWYEGTNAGASGYRVLPSNGRLESDLLDRLEDAFKTSVSKPSAAPAAANNTADVTDRPAEPLPSAPRSSATNIFGVPKSSSVPPPQPAGKASADDKGLQPLRDEAANLEQILQNQAHPTNLAIIKASHTPIYARPLETSKVLLEADAEDEFQIIETEAAWVHVQVSGLSRGWIPRSRVELPSEIVAKIPAAAENPDSPPKEGFREVREETSLFPGKWQPLDGKKVKIVWVQPFENQTLGENSRVLFAKSVFRRQYPELSKLAPAIWGIVVVFDSADGGMAAATFASLQQWRAGHLSEDAFWKQCWVDPAEAFKVKD